MFSFNFTLLWFDRADISVDLTRPYCGSVWIVGLMPLASGTMFGSCRSGSQRGSWQTAAQRRLWSLSDKLHSFYRSTRRRRQKPEPSATCVPPSTRHRSMISKCSALLNCRHVAASALILVCLCQQIVKVLTLYTPVIEFEERVSATFITTIKVSSYKVIILLFLFSGLSIWQYLLFCISLFSF